MSKNDDKPADGPKRKTFIMTCWTEIRAAMTLDPKRRSKATGRIMEWYWKPVYAYLILRGNNHDKASDLVQGFFVKVIERGLIQQADADKGRFRSLLLTALDNYAHDEYEKGITQKRRPSDGVKSLNAFEVPPPLSAIEASPEQAFDYAWASQLIDDVLADVEAQCRQAGQQQHWEVFRQTVLEPILFGAEIPPMPALCQELDIDTPKQAAAMNVTVKRRFKRILQAHVREFVASEEEVESEIGDLMEILSVVGARKETS
jgi:DNA-directed RNA polymerase specialized sigma24 family protein